MRFHIYYDRSESRCWWGFWMDKEGNQIMEAVNAHSKELVLIELGAQRSNALERMNNGETYP